MGGFSGDSVQLDHAKSAGSEGGVGFGTHVKTSEIEPRVGTAEPLDCSGEVRRLPGRGVEEQGAAAMGSDFDKLQACAKAWDRVEVVLREPFVGCRVPDADSDSKTR